MSNNSALFARQPIYNIDLKLHAYELLFRPVEEFNSADFYGDAATSQVILNIVSATDVHSVLDQRPAFINFTRNWLREIPPFPPDQVVVEVL